ncbi:hypothetical protein A0H76_2671 [Hepatospora eriocheir]|uniref:Uncharacterized protein n=1 Tax=Hepatospora eriocheir TaxID=1081669 RepID=A0A1X0QEW5_9MICR|nr:hypothetical protein A0H76_2671 [Hepatospora eriocheir]
MDVQNDIQNVKKLDWTNTKVILGLSLYLIGLFYLIAGIKPILDVMAEKREFLNLGFLALIIFFMMAAFKMKKNSHYYLWASAFGLVLYSETMYWFYEDIVF